MTAALHVHEDDLQMYIRGQLATDSAEEIEAHMRRCRGCKDRLADNARFVAQFDAAKGSAETYGGPEKRTEPRFRANDWGLLQPLAPLSFNRFVVRIVDVSRNGMGVAMAERLARGTLVQIRIDKTAVLAEVRYSRPYGGSFQIGLRVQDIHYPLKQAVAKEQIDKSSLQ